MLVTEDRVTGALERDTIYQSVGALARDSDPERMLPAVVELLEAARREIAALSLLNADLVARLTEEHAIRDFVDQRHAAAIATLAAYDAKRRTALLQTLERHLGDRGALAATARTLFIHTNTLRQRLERIESLTGLDLAQEDLLSLELALKLARLQGTVAA
jgi:DNA-binding PucR family transcriptional regulator